MSDRIGVMSKGELLQVDTPKRIYDRPATRFVADFIGESNFLAGQVETLESGKAVVSVAGVRCPVTNDIGVEAKQPVILCVRPEKVQLGTAQHADDVQLPGTIRDIIYIGTDTRYIVQLGTGELVVARIQNDEEESLESGDAVQVWWKPSDMRVLSE
jgi:spermidine/putrescine transport system ATP-binding protein